MNEQIKKREPKVRTFCRYCGRSFLSAQSNAEFDSAECRAKANILDSAGDAPPATYMTKAQYWTERERRDKSAPQEADQSECAVVANQPEVS